jgi:hypothetical protein
MGEDKTSPGDSRQGPGPASSTHRKKERRERERERRGREREKKERNPNFLSTDMMPQVEISTPDVMTDQS